MIRRHNDGNQVLVREARALQREEQGVRVFCLPLIPDVRRHSEAHHVRKRWRADALPREQQLGIAGIAMTKVKRNHDCGNSPKNMLLQELTVAIARSDEASLMKVLTDEVQWNPIGQKPISGAEAVCRGLVRYGKASSLSIEHVVSHGRSGAVDGVVVFGEKKRAFCHVYEFGSIKGIDVSGITTYSIAIK